MSGDHRPAFSLTGGRVDVTPLTVRHTMAYDRTFATSVLREINSTSHLHTVILGAGSDTRLVLLETDREVDSGIRAILDDDPNRRGEQIAGHVVRLTSDYPLERVRRVVITSQMYEPELTRRAGQLFGRNADIVYTYDRGRSLPSALCALCERIDRSWQEPHGEDALWYSADRLYTSLRGRLSTLPTWRYGATAQRPWVWGISCAFSASLKTYTATTPPNGWCGSS